MVEANPFADFQDDPFFSFGTNFGEDIFPAANLGIGGDLLELDPDLAFQGALQRNRPTPNLLQQFQGQRSQLFNQFQGLLDQQIRQGLVPNLRFGDFMGNFDFQRESFRTPPSERAGADVSQFRPRTEFFR
jgi:hypothetical protein